MPWPRRAQKLRDVGKKPYNLESRGMRLALGGARLGLVLLKELLASLWLDVRFRSHSGAVSFIRAVADL